MKKAFLSVLFMTPGCSSQLLLSAMLDSRAQLCPRGTLIADQRRACAARPQGKNEESPGRSLLQTERFKFFPATGGGWPGPLSILFKQLSRHNAAFFGTFLGSKKVPYPSRPFVPYRFSTTLTPLWMQLAGMVPRTLTKGYTCAPRPMTAPGLSTAPQPISA